MYKRFFKFAVTSLTILTAELIATVITDKLVSYRWEFKPVRFTLISMAIITIVFYPLLTKLEDWLNKVSKKFIRTGHSYAGKYLGLILMYFTGLVILTFFYAKYWYDINLFNYILNHHI